MATKGTASEIGESGPTEKSKGNIDNLVDDLVGEDSPESAGKESLDDTGLDKEGTEENVESKEDSKSEVSETDEGESSEDSSDETEDEVVPASKHKKVLEKMQRRIDELTRSVREAESKAQSQSQSQDQKLERLSSDELRDLRDNVDEAIIDAKVAAKTDGTDNVAKVAELRALKRSIEDTVKLAPKRFQQRQLSNLESVIQDVKDIDPEIVDKKGELWETAIKIYTKMPSLQRSETGQAEALAIATEYYVERKSVDNGRDRAKTLSKKVANLKRKTSLDGKNRDVNVQDVSAKKIREKAVSGSYYDKLDFVKTLIPDDYLE